MINLPHEKCYGCQGCANICPKDAISMAEDIYGYKYPQVNYQNCIKCGLCLKVCPELNKYELNSPIQVLAAVAKNKKTLKSTASGGFASILAEKILDEGGVVYGCCEDNFLSIGHIRVDRKEDLYKLKNSKYVHSDIRRTYKEAKNDLDLGLKVLYTGTPCQISGLIGFLRKKYDNLITMDLVCHGVPPMRMLEEQVLSYPEIQGEPYKDIFVDFRWKTRIRSGCSKSIRFGLRTVVRSGDEYKILREENDMVNPYMRNFQTGVSLRENCLHCPYAQEKRISDITAADFWGLGRLIPSTMLDFNGVSLLMINTITGKSYFNKVKNDFNYEERTMEEAKKFNRCLSQPFAYPRDREKFLSLYKEKGLIEATIQTDKIHRFECFRIVRKARNNKIGTLMVRILSKILRIANII